MSTSLRDQLMKAGLVSKQQVNEVERRQQRQSKPPPRQSSGAGASPTPRPTTVRGSTPVPGPTTAPAARPRHEKAARDQMLNQKQQEKAQRRALFAQIKQLIDQHRLPPSDTGEPYHFVDGGKIRHMTVDSAVRERLIRGELMIAHHAGRYDLVSPAIAARICERDPAVILAPAAGATVAVDEGYQAFVVPDDLIW